MCLEVILNSEIITQKHPSVKNMAPNRLQHGHKFTPGERKRASKAPTCATPAGRVPQGTHARPCSVHMHVSLSGRASA